MHTKLCSSAIELEVEFKDVSIELSKNNIAIFGKIIDPNELNKKLALIKNKKRNVILRIDENVQYKKIVKVLDALKTNDLNNLSLVTKVKTQE